MLIILYSFIVAIATFFYIRPLINNLLYSVPNEPKYIPSYIPYFGFELQMVKDPIEFIRSLYLKYGKVFVIRFASKRWVFLYDEQTYLTKVLKTNTLSIDHFLTDLMVRGVDINRQCLLDENIQRFTLKQYHQYLVGNELQVLSRRVYESLLESMKLDKKTFRNGTSRIVNMFHFFREFMLFATTEGLFGHSFTTAQRNLSPGFYKLFQDFNVAYELGVFSIPFRYIFYKSIYKNRNEFVRRFSSIKLNNGESELIHAREELYRCEEYKHLFREYDVNALQANLLWIGVVNTAPASCWTIVDLLLHREAYEAVKQELDQVLQSSSLPIYDKEILTKLKVLESCITESIRRVFDSSSIRQALTDTSIECVDGTTIGLRKGDMLMYPAFLKHFDPDVFGPYPYEYKYDRLLKKPDQPKSPSVMSFGCGIHTCPGRYWAINEIKILVALIIQHMDIDFINMLDIDKENYRKRPPCDHSKFITSAGLKKGYERKFQIKYAYKNLDAN